MKQACYWCAAMSHTHMHAHKHTPRLSVFLPDSKLGTCLLDEIKSHLKRKI